MKMKNEIALRPSYWASVSGGKDSLYMLDLILKNLDKYPLNGVVHYELEIDYPFIKDVVDYMESQCKSVGIPFMRFKPRKTWEEWYNTVYKSDKHKGMRYGFPSRTYRWCNSKYKLDAKKQLDEWLKSLGCYTVMYIGYCADEVKRFSKREKERYPLVEFGINENEILAWAKKHPIYNNYYKTNTRCGCMYCPMASSVNKAYLYKYYPENFKYMIEKAREHEKEMSEFYGRPFSVFSSNAKYNADYQEKMAKTKWLEKLEDTEKENEDE